ncbi:hypothetical protein BGT96224_2900B [Blumeria graminis f. sp. tritici 96224]|uniref:Bgt-2900-2 n=1 Tax=Blumeria graminis f. sp. tritici 96224 TaxID=1268274 RepID=A0A061HPH6_BLUGR|nr:hypothetical protein BGT96224_2900B [Blumeria graminis f. sp. tritici 96224]
MYATSLEAHIQFSWLWLLQILHLHHLVHRTLEQALTGTSHFPLLRYLCKTGQKYRLRSRLSLLVAVRICMLSKKVEEEH